MARVMMFMRDEMFVGERERNEEFRQRVKAFVPFVLGGLVDYVEYHVNTESGFNRAYSDNPDCELVFTCENDVKTQYAANNRDKLVFEWRCFGDKTFVPIKVEACLGIGYTMYRKYYYGIHPQG